MHCNCNKVHGRQTWVDDGRQTKVEVGKTWVDVEYGVDIGNMGNMGRRGTWVDMGRHGKSKLEVEVGSRSRKSKSKSKSSWNF
jgi:hypothetical protein